MSYLFNLFPADEWAWFVARVALHATIALAATLLANATLFRKLPTVRHALGLCCLAFVLISPLLGWVVQSWEVPRWKLPTGYLGSVHATMEANALTTNNGIAARSAAIPAASNRQPASIDQRSVAKPIDQQSGIGHSQLTDQPTATASPRAATRFVITRPLKQATFMLLAAVWLCGSGVALVRLVRGAWRLRKMRRAMLPVTEQGIIALLHEVCAVVGLRRTPAILTCPGIATPFALGLRRPVIVLPEAIASRISTAALRDVFTHETAHLVRRDPWVGLFQHGVTILFWPHLLIHLLNRQIAQAREELCDNYVLRLRSAAEYAQTLLDLTQLCRLQPQSQLAFALLPPSWNLRRRVTDILNPRRSRATRIGWGGLILLLAMASAAGLFVACGGTSLGPLPIENVSVVSVLHGRVVDEENHPVERAAVRFAAPHFFGNMQAITDEQGEFELPATKIASYCILLTEKEGTDGQTLRGCFKWWGTEARTFPVVIVLRPERTVQVNVVDGLGQPVAQADVRAHTTLWDVANATTDANGEATLRIPVDGVVESVLASKSGVGFDYYENYQSFPLTTYPPLPAEIQLRLTGFRRVEVRVIDSADDPVPGVRVMPWTVQMEGKLTHANLDGDEGVLTDENGIAVFETIPKELLGGVTFFVVDPRLYCPNPPTHRGEDDAVPLTAKVFRNARIHGKVTHQDGTPAAGIVIHGGGQGDRKDYFQISSLTRPDGTYSMLVNPHQTCMFAVLDERWASTAIMGQQFSEAEEVTGIDFQLLPGTLVRGRITKDANNGPPNVRHQVRLSQKGTPHTLGPFWNPTTIEAQLVHWDTTDANGEYRFCVGPGDYDLALHTLVQPTVIRLHVVGTEVEFTNNSYYTELARRPFAGQVLDAPQQPSPNASVWVQPSGPLANAVEFLADKEGNFAGEGWQHAMLIYARSSDGAKAVFSEVGVDDPSAELVLLPAASIVGVVYHANGKPAGNRWVQATIRHPSGSSQWNGLIASIFLMTDKHGRYSLPGLPLGANVDLLSNPDEGTQSTHGGHYIISHIGTINANDIRPR